MSSWWSCTFSVVGAREDIERFRNGLPGLEQAPDDDPLWHHAKIKLDYASFLCVDASRNYGGQDHAAQMVYEFPALTFLGLLHVDMDPYRWYTFHGHGGETTWREFTIEPTDEMERSDPIKEKALVERMIEESRSRLAEEQEELAQLEAHLAIVHRRISGDVGVDPVEDVRAIVEKIKGRPSTKREQHMPSST